MHLMLAMSHILKEFTDACRLYGVAAGIYISPYDRNSPCWGTSEYNTYFNNQLKEVLTGYGRIDEVWWDGAGSKDSKYDWGLWAHTVRNFQPDAVIFGSFGAAPYIECRWGGNEAGITGDPHYPTVDIISVEEEVVEELNRGKFGGDSFIIAEMDTSIRPGWFYHKEQDALVKTPKELVDLWFNSIGNSALMLLNFPPDRRGVIHEKDASNAIHANNIINRALSVNLAADGFVTASSTMEGFFADNMLVDNYDAVYVSKDLNPVIEISLREKREFDTFVIGEYIEKGIRVRGFTVEAFSDGEWKLISDNKSIGFKKAVYFGKVCSDKVRVTIYDAAAEPIIREFGLYNFSDAGYNPSERRKPLGETYNILDNSGAEVKIRDDGAVVMFGGVFPFNTVKFNGESFSCYELLIFNGSQFYSAKKGITKGGEVTVTLYETNKASYMIELKTDKRPSEDINIRVYEK